MEAVYFTDLDGTLLDHRTYEYAPALPALTRLEEAGVPLVLSSSKTAAEVAELHLALGLGDTPAIVENGSGLFDPAAPLRAEASAYEALLEALAGLPTELSGLFHGFGAMASEEVSQITGLSLEGARRAKARAFSEPGLWRGTEAQLGDFCGALLEQGIAARRGGRFLTLSFGRTKADAMAEVAARMGAQVTVALGDAPNDVEMLEAADFGVIVLNPCAAPLPELPGEARGAIRRTALAGPLGWNAAVLEILEELDL